MVQLVEIPPYHQTHHAVVCDFVAAEYSGVLSIAQHHNAISEFLYFAEAMGNVDNAYTAAAQFSDNPEKRVSLMLRKRRCRFVHNEHTRIHRKRFGNFDHLLPADGKAADERARSRICAIETDLLQRSGGGGLCLSSTNKPAYARFASEK